jgi:excinuclease ABC subunit A
MDARAAEALPGLCLHDLMLMLIDRLRRFFDASPFAARGSSSARHGEQQAPAFTKRSPRA